MAKFIFNKDFQTRAVVPLGSKMIGTSVTFKKGSVEEGEEKINPDIACPAVVGAEKCNRYVEIKIPGNNIVRVPYPGKGSVIDPFMVTASPKLPMPGQGRKLTPRQKFIGAGTVFTLAGAGIGVIINLLLKPARHSWIAPVAGACLGIGATFALKKKLEAMWTNRNNNRSVQNPVNNFAGNMVSNRNIKGPLEAGEMLVC